MDSNKYCQDCRKRKSRCTCYKKTPCLLCERKLHKCICIQRNCHYCGKLFTPLKV